MGLLRDRHSPNELRQRVISKTIYILFIYIMLYFKKKIPTLNALLFPEI